MGNNVGTQLTSLKVDLGKKIDDAKTRIQETVTEKKSEGTSQNGIHKPIPKISIHPSGSSTNLLNEDVIDKSLLGDVEIATDDIVYNDDISELNKQYEDESSVSVNYTQNVYSANKDCNYTMDKDNNNSGYTKDNEKDNDGKNISERNERSNEKKRGSYTLCMDDVCFRIRAEAEDVAKYCVPLLSARFNGQTSAETRSDKTDTKDVLHLGLYLKLVDKFLHQFETVEEFTGEEEEYLRLLKLVSLKRKQEQETTNQCFKRIILDSHRFVNIYHKRGVPSERLNHKKFWGSRQQLLSGKIIADWVDPHDGPLDPIFGVILQPTAGRAGPGDSGWIHNMLFDDCGYMAYHSAVHDAFGYLINYHGIGPGYNYLSKSMLDKQNPLSGQLSGVKFWKEIIDDIEEKQIVLEQIHL